MLESDGRCVLVDRQDSSDSDGLVTDGDRLLVAGVGDHERVIINMRVESDTYNGRQCNNFIGDGFIVPQSRDHIRIRRRVGRMPVKLNGTQYSLRSGRSSAAVRAVTESDRERV